MLYFILHCERPIKLLKGKGKACSTEIQRIMRKYVTKGEFPLQ